MLNNNREVTKEQNVEQVKIYGTIYRSTTYLLYLIILVYNKFIYLLSLHNSLKKTEKNNVSLPFFLSYNMQVHIIVKKKDEYKKRDSILNNKVANNKKLYQNIKEEVMNNVNKVSKMLYRPFKSYLKKPKYYLNLIKINK